MKRGSYETAWVTPGHDCLCSYAYGRGAAVRPQTNEAGSHPLRNTLRPAHQQAWWVALCLRVCKGLAEPGPLHRQTGETKWILLWLMVLLLLFWVCSLREHTLWGTLGWASGWVERRRGGGGVATAVGVHLTRRCAPILGILHVWLGEGVGHCRYTKSLSFWFLWGVFGKTMSFPGT